MAIALADFCRRADRPSPAAEVRQALARLSPDEDRAVEALCRGEPPARPLSPHAVIDLLRGLPAAEAARREAAGEYAAIAAAAAREAEAQEANALGAASVPAASAPAAEPAPPTAAASPFAPDEEAQRTRIRDAVARAGGDLARAADELGFEDAAALRRFAAKLGLLAELARAAARTSGTGAGKRKKREAASIGPIRRTKEEVEALRAQRQQRREEPAEEPPPPRPGRSPAPPVFGRYVSGPPARRPWSELEGPDGARILQELVTELRANRRQILARLDAFYERPSGPAGEAELRLLLERHGLRDWFAEVERENLRILLRQSRGFLPPVRRALGLEARELKRLLRRHGLEAEVAELKERTREEARAERPLGERVMLAAEKEEQLADAGVLGELDARNLAELRPAVEEIAREGTSRDPEVVAELARRRLGLEPRQWRRAVRRYRLVHLAAEILGVPPPEEPPPAPAPAPPERLQPARSHLPVGPRAGTRRREIPVLRIGAAPEAAAAGGLAPPRRRSGPAPGRPPAPRRFGAKPGAGGPGGDRRFAGKAGGGHAVGAGGRPPKRRQQPRGRSGKRRD